METNALLETYLRQLRLPTFLANYRKFAEDGAQADLSYDRFLLALAEQEVTQREKNRIERRIKMARFPVLRELADFDFSVIPSLSKAKVLDLARGEYIMRREPILLLGVPGVGKTHIATGLALAACRQGHKVRFYTAARLVNDLLEAQDDHSLGAFLTSALKLNLVVLDELGFIPLTTAGAQLLFTFCSEMHERVALIITTNLKFADWPQVLGDERLTAALLDRLTHRATILELLGESFRYRERMQQKAKVNVTTDEPSGH
jgi:DNA replication protein DnaC